MNYTSVLFELHLFPWLLPDLLDGTRDSIGYDSALLSSHGVTANVTAGADLTSRVVVFEGQASDRQYMEVSTR